MNPIESGRHIFTFFNHAQQVSQNKAASWEPKQFFKKIQLTGLNCMRSVGRNMKNLLSCVKPSETLRRNQSFASVSSASFDGYLDHASEGLNVQSSSGQQESHVLNTSQFEFSIPAPVIQQENQPVERGVAPALSDIVKEGQQSITVIDLDELFMGIPDDSDTESQASSDSFGDLEPEYRTIIKNFVSEYMPRSPRFSKA